MGEIVESAKLVWKLKREKLMGIQWKLQGKTTNSPWSNQPNGPTTETCGPNSSNSGTHGPRPSSIRVNTYPLLIWKDLLNRFEPLIDFKHLKTWTQVREPLSCQALDFNKSQCQINDITPKSLIDDAVAKPGSEPSTNSKDPFLSRSLNQTQAPFKS